MSHVKKSIYAILPILLLMPLMGFGQNIEQKDSSNTKLISAAREIMHAAGTCALITLNEKDIPVVRAMSPFLPESDFTVWFGTNPESRKVNEIKKNPNVTLYYLDSDASGYVMIHGLAQLVDDPKQKEMRWKDEWEDFYPNRTEGYLLIKVTPQSMEVVSPTRDVIGDAKTWKPPVAFFETKK